MSYATDQHVQADMWRTGSSWFGRVLLRAGGRRLAEGRHLTAIQARVHAPGRQVVGTVREPIAWALSYRSWLRRNRPEVDVGRTGEEWLEWMLEGREWPLIAPLVAVGTGFAWEALTRTFYGGADLLLDQSQLREGAALIGYRDSLGRRNVSPPHGERIPARLEALVYEACPTAAELGYTGYGSSAHAPVLEGL